MSNIEDNRLQGTGFQFSLNEKLNIYPNPFTSRTTIRFPNPQGDKYYLILMDLSGRVLRILDNLANNEVVLERKGLPDGIYFIELQGPIIYRGKMVLE
jgi:hypothetical protein